jgi:MYND finger
LDLISHTLRSESPSTPWSSGGNLVDPHHKSCLYPIHGAEVWLVLALRHVPLEFTPNLKVIHINKVLKEYATRVAFNMVFPICWTEEPGPGSLGSSTDQADHGKSCAACGATKRMGTPDGPLLACARCTKASYCSANFQRTHWKEYKKTCKAG